MNYRSKKISMKERLEEAIQEIGCEPLQSSRFERKTPEKRHAKWSLLLRVSPAARSQPDAGERYTHV
jgi:hypothetical protein